MKPARPLLSVAGLMQGGWDVRYLKRLLGMFKEHLSEAEQILLDQYLDDSGQFLFLQMGRVERYHALAVAQTVLQEAGYQRGINLPVLVKAALLHDVGKVEGDLNFWNRLAAGLIRRVKPDWREKYAQANRSERWPAIRYGFYVDLMHPVRGSYMAQSLGIEPGVVELIRRHHDPPVSGQTPELTWLQAADNKN